MRIELFRLGIAFILLAIMFPLVEIVDNIQGTETAFVTLFLWLIGVLLVFVSAFSTSRGYSSKAMVPEF